MFLSLALSHNSLDFYLQCISFSKSHFLKNSLASFLALHSFKVRLLPSYILSQASTSSRASFLLVSTFPKHSLFHTFSLVFSFLSFLERMKLVVPLADPSFYRPLNKPWNPSTFNHIFPKWKGFDPFLAPPHSSKMVK